jgi:feruloyl esterase
LVLGEPLSDVVNAMDPDLSRFRAHGGKLIQYHGWTDPWITPSSVPYYEQVLSATNPADRSIALLGTQNFYRLFMVPGMQHCHGGPGPVSFGQTTPFVGSASDTIPLSEDPEHDILLAIRAWVEQDAAPEKIIAAKYQNDTPAQGVLFSRPLCPYPLTAQYSGSGDTSDAANFSCANEHLRLNRNPGFTDRPMEITPQ